MNDKDTEIMINTYKNELEKMFLMKIIFNKYWESNNICDNEDSERLYKNWKKLNKGCDIKESFASKYNQVKGIETVLKALGYSEREIGKTRNFMYTITKNNIENYIKRKEIDLLFSEGLNYYNRLKGLY
jgi:hypothetical protein